MRLVGVARLDQRLGREGRRGLVGCRWRSIDGKRPKRSASSPSSGTCSRLPTRKAPPRAPAHWRPRKATIASRVKVWMCSAGPSTGRPERVVAEGGAVDQVLGDHGGLVVGARDLLHDDAALAVELLGVDPRAADEVRQQVDRAADDLGPAGEVEGHDVVGRVGVEHRAHLLGGLVDLAVVVVELAALEHQVLEEVGHAVLLGALRASAGLEGDEDGDGARALELDAVEGKAVGEGFGADRGHASEASERDCLAGLFPGPSKDPRYPLARDGRHRQPPTPYRTHAPPQRASAAGGRGDRRPALGHQALLEGRHRRRGRHLRRPAGGVRVHRRRVGLGQVDARAAADQGVRADLRLDHRGRPRPRLDPALEDPLLPPQRRRDLPGLQAAAEPHGPRQRRLRPPGHGRQAPRDPREGARHPAPDRALDEAPQLPRPALGRRAAARVGRARVRQPPAAAAGRRADRQPRPRDLDRDHAAALPHQPHRHDGDRRDPRQGDGRPHAPARDRAGRAAASSATRPPAAYST